MSEKDSNVLVLFPYTHFTNIEHFVLNAVDIAKHIPMIFAPCLTDDTYDETLKALWNYDGDLIVMEHDIHAEISDVLSLYTCPYPLCARNYYIYQDILVHRNMKDGIPIFINEHDEWADLVGLGLTKIGRMFRRGHDPLWTDNPSDIGSTGIKPLTLDSRLSFWTKSLGFRWHIHNPIIHHSKEIV